MGRDRRNPPASDRLLALAAAALLTVGACGGGGGGAKEAARDHAQAGTSATTGEPSSTADPPAADGGGEAQTPAGTSAGTTDPAPPAPAGTAARRPAGSGKAPSTPRTPTGSGTGGGDTAPAAPARAAAPVPRTPGPSLLVDRPIVFVRAEGDGEPEIAVMNPDGKGVRRLGAATAGAFLPAWSPDATQIVFSRVDKENNTCPSEFPHRLFVVNANGSGLRRLTRTEPCDLHVEAAWSPDGQQIAYSDGLNIRVVDADGTDDQPLHKRHDFGGARPGDTYINMNQFRDGESKPTWSPDSREIAFARSGATDVINGLMIAQADGTGERIVIDNAYQPNWSSKGTIVFTRPSEGEQATLDILSVKPDGSGQKTLTKAPKYTGTGLKGGSVPERNGSPAWSPDGASIVFISNRENTGPGVTHGSDIYVMAGDGTNVRRIAKQQGGPGEPVRASAFPSW